MQRRLRTSTEENIVKDGSDSIEDAQDAALEMTFPASDPIALFLQEYDWRSEARLPDPRATCVRIPMLNRKA